MVLRTDEVDDEAAVGVAAGGAAEEGGAVGWARDKVEDGVGGEDDGVVAGVGEGVAEAEDGVVAPGGEACGGGRRDQRPCPSQVRDQEEQQNGARQLAHLGGHGLTTPRSGLGFSGEQLPQL